ncbi:hypothetical protein CAOG_08692 [Capsaspora owczarzaki ATCC 30864]|uniref:Receptor for retinol uptake STRA6 n=1 Tax=Capsaspora owczarzaki (strain ATCC 30864) TaxID=595528 RepID=A0A0D2VPC2_CAPO3|nr:hypothetical protein CAOG_08692 [Capsaspora owczarzaki ATCC 30864]KJE92302.1 hypothetical protein CAOG_008692 [Capsaspora owczarzaki ATCC 30864]|eukprot:XP_011270303.1 hypothetical protein CAOG_08692 [Capsaspora owczarzaki ATCC 30864]
MFGQGEFGDSGSNSTTDSGAPDYVPAVLNDIRLIAAGVIVLLGVMLKPRTSEAHLKHMGPSVPIPMNFLENRSERLMTAFLFGSAGSSIFSVYFFDPLPDSVNTYYVQYYYMALLLQVAFQFYPLFVCHTYRDHPLMLVVGWLYSMYMFALLVYSTAIQANFFPFAVSVIPTLICMAIVVLHFTKGVFFLLTSKHSSSTASDHAETLEKYRVYVQSRLVARAGAPRAGFAPPTSSDGPGLRSGKIDRFLHDDSMKALLRPRGSLPVRFESVSPATASTTTTSPQSFTLPFYQTVPGFLYSPRLISTFVVTGVILFELFILLLFIALSVSDLLVELYRNAVSQHTLDEIQVISKVCALVAMALTILLLVWCAFQTILTYRSHICMMRRGNYSFIRPGILAQRRHMSDTVRYSGYQIAYMMLSFAFTSIVLLLVCSLIAMSLFVDAIREVFWPWALNYFFFPLLVSFGFMFFQYVLARFVFSVDMSMSIDNRRLWHNFDYFYIFVNIVVGLFSYLARVLKALLFIALFFSRLDKCVTLNDYEGWDQGYRAYIGFLMLDHYYGNPYLVLAVANFASHQSVDSHQALMQPASTRNSSGNGDNAAKRNRMSLHQKMSNRVLATSTSNDPYEPRSRPLLAHSDEENSYHTIARPRDPDSAGYTKARLRWQVAYTLLNNPHIIPLRKHHLGTSLFSVQYQLVAPSSSVTPSTSSDASRSSTTL